jgi:hypothetical protein
MIRRTTMLAITLAGALAATGAMAQTKQGDKNSQKFSRNKPRRNNPHAEV